MTIELKNLRLADSGKRKKELKNCRTRTKELKIIKEMSSVGLEAVEFDEVLTNLFSCIWVGFQQTVGFEVEVLDEPDESSPAQRARRWSVIFRYSSLLRKS